MNVSLDDMIAANRKRGNPRGRRFTDNRSGFVQRNNGRGRYKGNASERWVNDGFSFVHGSGRQTVSNGISGGPLRGGLSVGGFGGPCRVNIANLHNVGLDDLEELFMAYVHDGITMHYDHMGNPVGTADIHFRRRPSEAARLVKDCSGMRIDGRAIKFFLLGPRPATAFVQKASGGRFESKFNRVGSKFVQNNRSGGRYVKTQGGKVNKDTTSAGKFYKKKPMTEEELNKQLDEYMTKK